MQLTLSHIRKAIKGDKRFDQTIDLDEEGKAILYLNDPWTWCANDGNRTVEGFIYADDADCGERDTLEYFKDRISMIERQI